MAEYSAASITADTADVVLFVVEVEGQINTESANLHRDAVDEPIDNLGNVGLEHQVVEDRGHHIANGAAIVNMLCSTVNLDTVRSSVDWFRSSRALREVIIIILINF